MLSWLSRLSPSYLSLLHSSSFIFLLHSCSVSAGWRRRRRGRPPWPPPSATRVGSDGGEETVVSAPPPERQRRTELSELEGLVLFVWAGLGCRAAVHIGKWAHFSFSKSIVMFFTYPTANEICEVVNGIKTTLHLRETRYFFTWEQQPMLDGIVYLLLIYKICIGRVLRMYG
jgi:hypothetical protein